MSTDLGRWWSSSWSAFIIVYNFINYVHHFIYIFNILYCFILYSPLIFTSYIFTFYIHLLYSSLIFTSYIHLFYIHLLYSSLIFTSYIHLLHSHLTFTYNIGPIYMPSYIFSGTHCTSHFIYNVYYTSLFIIFNSVNITVISSC